ncbi:MAG: hypothetical protein OYK82_09180 [Gammaproteobacteria bacterium]|nr:hypothetical protein [Gammaproteobacteria bacterium]
MATYVGWAKLRGEGGPKYMVAVGSYPEQLPVYTVDHDGAPLIATQLRWPSAIWRMPVENIEELHDAKKSSLAKVQERWGKVPKPLPIEHVPARR